jgi:hypothetical protein
MHTRGTRGCCSLVREALMTKTLSVTKAILAFTWQSGSISSALNLVAFSVGHV